MKINLLDKDDVITYNDSSTKKSGVITDDDNDDIKTEGYAYIPILDEDDIITRGDAKKDKVLSTDPFQIKNNPTSGQIELADWFYDLVKNVSGIYHIRRIHYKTIGKIKPNGEVYRNTINDSGLLARSSMFARYLGLIDWDKVEDHKNPGSIKVTVYNDDIVDTNLLLYESGLIKKEIESSNQTINIGNGKIKYDMQTRQPYHIEIWCEKSTINDILIPIVNRYEATLVIAGGHFSITNVKDCYERIKYLSKPVIIFYLRDFDPAGETMAKAVARKLEWFVRKGKKNSDYSNFELDVKLIDVALNYDQCIRYELPREPMEDRSHQYKGNFEEKFGEGATELDSFIAIREEEFKDLLVDWIEKYYDKELDDKIKEHNINEQKRFENYKNDLIDQIINANKDDLELSVERYNNKLLELNEIGNHIDSIVENTIDKIDIEKFKVEDPPESEAVSQVVSQEDDDINGDIYILDTKLTYGEQLKKYKSMKLMK